MLNEYQLYDYSCCFTIEESTQEKRFEFAIEQDSTERLLHCVDQIIVFLQTRTELDLEHASFKFLLSCPGEAFPSQVDLDEFESQFNRTVRARWMGSSSSGLEELSRHSFELRSSEQNAKEIADFKSKCAVSEVKNWKQLFGYDLVLPRLVRNDATCNPDQFTINIANSPYSMHFRFYGGGADHYDERFVVHSDLLKAKVSSRSMVELANSCLLSCSKINSYPEAGGVEVETFHVWDEAFLPSHMSAGSFLLAPKVLTEIQETLGSDEICFLGDGSRSLFTKDMDIAKDKQLSVFCTNLPKPDDLYNDRGYRCSGSQDYFCRSILRISSGEVIGHFEFQQRDSDRRRSIVEEAIFKVYVKCAIELACDLDIDNPLSFIQSYYSKHLEGESFEPLFAHALMLLNADPSLSEIVAAGEEDRSHFRIDEVAEVLHELSYLALDQPFRRLVRFLIQHRTFSCMSYSGWWHTYTKEIQELLHLCFSGSGPVSRVGYFTTFGNLEYIVVYANSVSEAKSKIVEELTTALSLFGTNGGLQKMLDYQNSGSESGYYYPIDLFPINYWYTRPKEIRQLEELLDNVVPEICRELGLSLSFKLSVLVSIRESDDYDWCWFR